jgi:ParB family chromosome partitioning protein
VAQDGGSNDKLVWSNDKRRLGDLVPWPRNPRLVMQADAQALVESHEEFGQPETIAVGPDDDVYNGHQRLYTWLDKYGPDFEVAVRVSSRPLTEDERERLTLYLHEKATGEWNWDELVNWGDDTLEWGFGRQKLEDLGVMIPDFMPADGSEQPRLDRKKPVVCPECGHEFISHG